MRKYLKQFRDKFGMTMQEVADKLNISRQYYQQIEAGERQKKMDITLVAKIADIFCVSLEEIFKYEEAITEITNDPFLKEQQTPYNITKPEQ